jgi:signal recognition particle subunit SRP54
MLDGFEVFHPDRIASRILGMGDIVSLVEDVEQKIDKQKADKWAKKFKKGQGFDFEDFLDQLEQMNNLGGIAGIIGKIPGLSQIPQAMKEQVNDKKFTQMKAIIQSMTIKERRRPLLMQNSSSRKRRIANGAGVELVEVGRLIKQFEKMQKMMEKISKGGIMNMMKQFKGQLPPGMSLPGL